MIYKNKCCIIQIVKNKYLVLWLSWLERFVHIEEVIGSSPIKTTTILSPLLWGFFILSKSFAFFVEGDWAGETLLYLGFYPIVMGAAEDYILNILKSFKVFFYVWQKRGKIAATGVYKVG